MKFLNLMIMMLSVMLSIAFFTLMERKFIGFMQNRKGPNKTSIKGITQPIADAAKLLAKETVANFKTNFSMFMVAPAMNLTCSLAMWMMFPFAFNQSFMKMSLLFIMSCMSMNLISMMMMSWSSNSNYAFIGMMRTISQMVAYEINLIFIVMIIINLTNEINLNHMWSAQKYSPMIFILPMTLMWLIVVISETNRTPFDFSEGESELISGFNIEYSSSSFMFLFLSEYSSILLMSMMTTLMFSSLNPTQIHFYAMYISMCFFFIWTRAALPRFRYDKLMKLNWTQLLPANTYFLFWSFVYKMYCAMKN